MKFQYTGVTRQQEETAGMVEAQDEIEARIKIRALQVRPLEVSPMSGNVFERDLFKIDVNFSPPIDLKGLVIFMRQFSSLIDSGVPIVQCLDILCQQEKRPRFKEILRTIKEDIESGSSLAGAIAKHPRAFSEFAIRVIEAGEVSGTLDKSLKRISQQLEKLGILRAKVKNAMIYPMVTLVVAVVVTIFLLIKVIPEVSKLYAESSAELPALTAFVLGLSKWVLSNFLYMIVGTAGAIAGFVMAYRLQSFRIVWDAFVLKVPMFGSLIMKSSVARFTRTLGTLISSGVPLLSAFDICIKITDNLSVKNVLATTAQSVTEGKSIVQGLQIGGLFPPMVLHMVNIGEMTGRLDELLNKVSDIYDDEVDQAINVLTGMLQPAMIVVVGIIIAFLLLAMYMPIFQLADKVVGK